MENCKTTVIDCDFKDISGTFKTTVTNGDFIHLKKKFMWILIWIQKISLTNILICTCTILTIILYIPMDYFGLKLPNSTMNCPRVTIFVVSQWHL